MSSVWPRVAFRLSPDDLYDCLTEFAQDTIEM